MSDEAPQRVRYVREGRVARVTLDSPPLHILDQVTVRQLDAALARAAEEEASVVVLCATGTKAFSAGVSVQDHDPAVMGETLRAFHAVFHRLYHAPYVTIAQVRGRALGGGCELALFCDIVIAADAARFALPEIDLGCFPPVALSAFSYRFGRKAFELLLTGETIYADEALTGGLVSECVPRYELAERVDALAATLAAKSAPVLALTVRAARALWSPGFERALADAERIYLEELVQLPDHREGLAAFLEKRAPAFTHEETPESPTTNEQQETER